MVLDELETFEHDRRLQPLTVPVLMERSTYYVVDLAVGTLPARSKLRLRDQRRRAQRDDSTGRRTSESRTVVRRCISFWKAHVDPGDYVELHSDQKKSYRKIFREVFTGHPRTHVWEHSSRTRNRKNVLFPINHTNAFLRDTVSRLVRRSWGHSKNRERLARHLWIWVGFRNYVRGITRLAPGITAAQAYGICDRRYSWTEVLRWRAPFFSLLYAHGTGPVSGEYLSW